MSVWSIIFKSCYCKVSSTSVNQDLGITKHFQLSGFRSTNVSYIHLLARSLLAESQQEKTNRIAVFL